jgi:hypothetical protein
MKECRTRDEIFLREHHACDGRPMNVECLEELRTLAQSLGVLDDDTYYSTGCAIYNLYPVAIYI